MIASISETDDNLKEKLAEIEEKERKEEEKKKHERKNSLISELFSTEKSYLANLDFLNTVFFLLFNDSFL